MPGLRVDVISIGTLGRNRLWNESSQVRTPHATTTLIRAGARHILVDPGLPAPAIKARLNERTGLRPEQVDTVFLTNFREAHRRGLEAFERAKVLIHEVEKQSARQHLERMIDQAPSEDVDRRHMENELAMLEKFSAAEDELAEGVDLFPLPGYTPGTCGLLVALPTTTVLIAGDAVPTLDHF